MAQQRHLKNAPITEALIDFRVQPSRKVDAQTPQMLTKRLGDAYVLKGPIHMNQIHLDQELEATIAKEVHGYRFHSADEKFVAQFQNQGFTLSRLAPYTDWDHLRHEAESLWPHYVDAMKPGRILQVACRYINNLRLPMRVGQDFGDFLAAAPQVPPALPQMLVTFMQRVVLPYPELNAITILTQLLEPNAAPPPLDKVIPVPVILDIDVQCRQPFEPHSSDVWPCLDRLRGLKNAAFFESIRETAAKLYE